MIQAAKLWGLDHGYRDLTQRYIGEYDGRCLENCGRFWQGLCCGSSITWGGGVEGFRGPES